MRDTPEDTVFVHAVETDPVPAPADEKALPAEELGEPLYSDEEYVDALLPLVDMVEEPPGEPLLPPVNELEVLLVLSPLPYVGTDGLVDGASNPVVAELEAVLRVPEADDAVAEPLSEVAPVGPDDSPEWPPGNDDDDVVEPRLLPELDAVSILREVEDAVAEPLGEDAPVGPDDSPELPPVDDDADETEPRPLLELENRDDEEPSTVEEGGTEPLTVDVGFP